jgi:hypothetical protein
VADSVLYFPYINVPNEAWFTRTLFYWDSVGCIRPADYQPRGWRSHDQRRADPRWEHTIDLIDAGLVKPVDPERALRAPEYFVSLERHLDAIEPPRGGLDVRDTTPVSVHRGKLGIFVTQELARRGLALPGNNGPWLPVKREAAEVVVGHLAAWLSGAEHMTLITDRRDSLQPFTGNVEARDLLTPRTELRDSVLEAILPAPDSPLPAFEIADFKEHHGDRLVAFRREVERRLRHVAVTSDEEERARRLQLLRDELAEDVDEISARIRESNPGVRVSRHTLAAISSVALPAVTAAAGRDWLAATASLPALLLACQSLRGRSDPEVLDQPLAYAAIAQRRFAG